jgi:hypothetical protein
MECQTKLLQIVFALRAPRCFSCLLYGRQQQSDENGNDRNDHQEFDKSETTTSDSHLNTSLKPEKIGDR